LFLREHCRFPRKSIPEPAAHILSAQFNPSLICGLLLYWSFRTPQAALLNVSLPFFICFFIDQLLSAMTENKS
jgi:hypothetical protein